MNAQTKATVEKIPLLKTRAGPRDGEQWVERLKEEFVALIKYIEINKENDNDWFKVEPTPDGIKWKGTCWYVHNLVKYEFDLQFGDVPRGADRTGVAGIRRQDAENVPRGQDMPRYTFFPFVAE
eukprot:GEMP01080349.1.p2 GENE.GEMP01080349.1~~GEMP01080349.1.p2  ORF type:complete len:124 (+),score=26.03 GEMP01080349.1:54-425(+)